MISPRKTSEKMLMSKTIIGVTTTMRSMTALTLMMAEPPSRYVTLGRAMWGGEEPWSVGA